jgi:type VI secretion system protein
VQGASEWSAPTGAPPPLGADDIWGKFAASNVVDWARGGFGKATPPIAAPVPSANLPAAETSRGWGAGAAAEPVASIPPAPDVAPSVAPASAAPPPPTGPGSLPPISVVAQLAQAMNVPADTLQLGDAGTLGMAGNLLRRLISGLVVMLEARARAKSQLGAQGTSLEFAGNNPLKFARTPEQALTQLLNDPQRGFMGSDQAIEDAFKDLQAHQMATLAAMQGALRATLDRFSPNAIRKRAETGGFLSKVLPGARDAALWKAYEREFSGVAQGSDEAFMDVFAKEFRKAYEEAAKR